MGTRHVACGTPRALRSVRHAGMAVAWPRRPWQAPRDWRQRGSGLPHRRWRRTLWLIALALRVQGCLLGPVIQRNIMNYERIRRLDW